MNHKIQAVVRFNMPHTLGPGVVLPNLDQTEIEPFYSG